MSVTCGFFNSLNGDRKYNTEEISRIFDGIIRDGIFATIGTSFIVKADSENRVTVGIGRAWFDHTWTYNDSILPIILEDSDMLQNRIDAVVLEINHTNDVRENSIKVIKGEAEETPKRPNMIKSEKINQYPLAYIFRGADTTNINQEDITNMVGSEETPFVTGILDVISLDELLGQWQNELDLFVDRNQEDFTTWYNGMKSTLEAIEQEFTLWSDNQKTNFNEWTEEQKIAYTNWITNKENEMNQWTEKEKAKFIDWFNSIQEQLSDNIITNFQSQINNINDKVNGLVSKTTTFNEDGSITETYGNEKKIIVFNSNGSITETLYVNDIKTKTKNIIFNDDGSITEVCE